MAGDDNAPPKVDDLLPLQRNFQMSLADRIRAMEGVPSHIRRKRLIEDLLERIQKELLVVLASSGELAARARAGELDLVRLNTLIDDHNRYYPIEANLPIDVATGRLLDKNGAFFEPLPFVSPASLVSAAAGRRR
jgi:hypothetical protein